ncbi:MAG: dihydroorotase [Rubrimonas sp.]
MTTLFRDALLIDPETGHARPGALLVIGDRIADLAEGAAPGAPEGAEVVACGGAPLAPGIVDLGVTVGEPGARHRESFRSAGRAAAAGGVTTMVVQPDTTPCLDDPALIEFVQRRAIEAAEVRVLALGALTKGLEGREMAELGLLADAGAVAFSDAQRPVADARVFRRCLSYADSLGGLVIHHPQEPSLCAGACATETEFSGRLGLPGAPAMAERILLERDLALVELTGARYHADCLTTAGALAALARAKDAGLAVTAGVSVHHATLNDLDIGGWRTFFKLDPPLRREEDREAVADALADGLIDVLCSGHMPQDEESKRLPFEAAAAGAAGLETLLPAALRLHHAGIMGLPALFRALSLNPSRLLGLETGRLARGAPADLVLFDPDAPHVLDRTTLRSKSKNTPFDGARMTGRVLRTVVRGRTVFDRAAEG